MCCEQEKNRQAEETAPTGEKIYRHMLCGYLQKPPEWIENDNIVTASAALLDGLCVVYYETEGKDVGIDSVTRAKTRSFPDGKGWYEMPKIFHYFQSEDSRLWQRRLKGKTPNFSAMLLNYDRISEYIYHHYAHQENNQYGVDKYCSIYIYKNIIVMYGETPEEKITLDELRGKKSVPVDSEEWDRMMYPIFCSWNGSGEKIWRKLKVIHSYCKE